MADISAFPTIRNVLYSGNNIVQLKGSGTIKAGMVVAFATSGTSDTVLAAKKGTTGQVIGVAVTDIATGTYGPIALDGCIVYVANADASTAIDAGDVVEDNDNNVTGTVSTVAATTSGAVATLTKMVGIAVDIIAGGGTGRMLISCGYYTTANTT
jgi:predicted RecA/RadA family phage recombinase